MDFSDLFFIDASGYHSSDYPTVQNWLIAQYQGIYGADVYLQPDSQDGQFIAVIAKALYDTGNLGAAVYNSFSPVTSQGIGLSRNVKINGISRLVSSFSSVTLTIVGQAGVTIVNGVATDSLQQQWLLPASVVIPGGGTIAVTATAAISGAVTADPNTITTIFTPTLGWQTVNNAAAATPGAPVETDAALRVRQGQSTANPSLTVLEGTYGAIANLTGVTKLALYENDTGSTDGNGVPAHSICAVVAGGVTAAIAQAIQIHKTPGTGTFGNVSTTVYDSHGMPLLIKFQSAATTTIQVTVTGSLTTGWTSDYANLIKAAVVAAVNAVGIGQIVYYTKLFTPAYLFGTPAAGTFSIASITIGKNGGAQSAANISLLFNENPVCTLADVTVAIS